MVNIVLIGCGRIGERHLESLLTLNQSFNIQVYDKFIKKDSDMFVNEIENLTDDIDICIVATTADVRKSIVEELVSKKNVKHLILEKVAFQSIKDFESVISLIEEKGINCYVNCPLRLQPIYEKVNELLELNSKTDFTYEYSDDFKISSSFIHILDLFCFFCNDYDIYIYNNLKEVMSSTKHKGFVDFTGKLHVKNSSGHNLFLTKGTNKFTEVLQIHNDDINIYACEGGSEKEIDNDRIGKVILNGKQTYKIPFLWQSHLTAQYIKQIMKNGNCDLPTLNESFKTHKPMINCFNEFLSETKGKKIEKCPIT